MLRDQSAREGDRSRQRGLLQRSSSTYRRKSRHVVAEPIRSDVNAPKEPLRGVFILRFSSFSKPAENNTEINNTEINNTEINNTEIKEPHVRHRGIRPHPQAHP